ncbi:hypothetical protein F5Y14DRAFT_410476 [Nemania sp. NC0429]|nr:hypothetical protein F5Y14DRAFT_410476 [Nemania sp. NC0429]
MVLRVCLLIPTARIATTHVARIALLEERERAQVPWTEAVSFAYHLCPFRFPTTRPTHSTTPDQIHPFSAFSTGVTFEWWVFGIEASWTGRSNFPVKNRNLLLMVLVINRKRFFPFFRTQVVY